MGLTKEQLNIKEGLAFLDDESKPDIEFREVSDEDLAIDSYYTYSIQLLEEKSGQKITRENVIKVEKQVYKSFNYRIQYTVDSYKYLGITFIPFVMYHERPHCTIELLGKSSVSFFGETLMGGYQEIDIESLTEIKNYMLSAALEYLNSFLVERNYDVSQLKLNKVYASCEWNEFQVPL